jgi:hypothetical protein
MHSKESDACRPAREIWQWRQVHGFASDRSLVDLEEIILRHTQTTKTHALLKKVLAFGKPPGEVEWREIRQAAAALAEALERDNTREYPKWF